MKMAAYEPFFAFEDVEVEDVELENVEVEENPSGKRYWYWDLESDHLKIII